MSNSEGELPVGGMRPVRIGDYLANVVRDKDSRPPDAPGVYLISERKWEVSPDTESGVIYVGQASYLRYRIGQLLSDLFGFTSEDCADAEAYQHRGGHWLWHRHCVERHLEPVNLYLAWRARCRCLDCAEARLHELVAIESKSPVRRCTRHHRLLELSSSWSAMAAAPAGTLHLRRISRN